MKKNKPASADTATQEERPKYAHQALGITDERMNFLSNTMVEKLTAASKGNPDFDMSDALKIGLEVAETREEAMIVAMGVSRNFQERNNPMSELAALLAGLGKEEEEEKESVEA